ncbi:MAG: hypothetical protein IMZ61_11545 [Planctomycetes bacterium]|nr:hypothetical protein [Planctomycetota bacterium]
MPNTNNSDTIQTLVAHAQQNHLTEPNLDELVHDLKSKEASSINNGGIQEQITYIIEQLGPTEAMAEIDKLI